MEAASNMHTCYYREGYDISMPLVPRKVYHDLENIAPLDREFFLTVKVRGVTRGGGEPSPGIPCD